MPHGYAIAIGMIAAAEVSARRYDFDADLVRAPLAQLGLPLAAPALDPDDVMPFISRDKKRTANGLRMVLLREIGDPTVELVSDADVAAGLAAVGIG
jgi:3-dehydroquinate synthase